jgi:hypothetical protein
MLKGDGECPTLNEEENVELWKAGDDLTRRHEDTKVGKTVKACRPF